MFQTGIGTGLSFNVEQGIKYRADGVLKKTIDIRSDINQKIITFTRGYRDTFSS